MTKARPTSSAEDVLHVPLSQLHESPWNPRTQFDAQELEELADSIEEKQILTPLLVRPRTGGGYEIGAGHRRRRAALLVTQRRGIAPSEYDVLVVSRPLTDAEFLEVLVFENDHRADVHPLDEAEGFRLLMARAGYDVAKLAKRAGRHMDYVYDRLRLLQLTPEAQRLFRAGKFELGHAILLARLTPDDQAVALSPTVNRYDGGQRSGLFQGERTLWAQEVEDPDPYAGLKPVTVREFRDWVDHRVRFDVEAADLGDLFPETADALVAAEEVELTTVHITHLHQVPDSARRADQRTYCVQSWTRADGTPGAKECEHSVLGVVVIGPHRGDAFPVCVDKERCRVHYSAWQRERAKRKQERTQERAQSVGHSPVTGPATAPTAPRGSSGADAQRQAVFTRQLTRATVEAIAARVEADPVQPGSPVWAIVVDDMIERYNENDALTDLVAVGSTPASLLRALALRILYDDGFGVMNLSTESEIRKLRWAEPLGLDAPAIVASATAALDAVIPAKVAAQ